MSGEAADDERTIDADPARLAELAGADDERTIDADVDLLDHVRTAVREARDRLAAPPVTGDEPAPAAEEQEGPWSPPSPGGATSSLLTTHGYWMARIWFVTDDGAEPNAGEIQFMTSVLYDSFVAS